MSASQQRKDRELIGQHSRLYERLYGDVAVAEGDDLPFHPVLARAWILTPRQKERALADYNRQKRDVGNMQLLAIAFPIHFFLLDQWFLGFLFWFSSAESASGGSSSGSSCRIEWIAITTSSPTRSSSATC